MTSLNIPLLLLSTVSPDQFSAIDTGIPSLNFDYMVVKLLDGGPRGFGWDDQETDSARLIYRFNMLLLDSSATLSLIDDEVAFHALTSCSHRYTETAVIIFPAAFLDCILRLDSA
jgi:hypothetical protein